MKTLTLQWKMIDKKHVALVFDRDTWRVYETEAEQRGEETCDMIAFAVMRLLAETPGGLRQ